MDNTTECGICSELDDFLSHVGIDLGEVPAAMLEDSIGVSPLGAAYLKSQNSAYDTTCQLPLLTQPLSAHATLDISIELDTSQLRRVVDLLMNTYGAETTAERHANKAEETSKSRHKHLLDLLADALASTALWWGSETTTDHACADVRSTTQAVLNTWSLTTPTTTPKHPPSALHLGAVLRGAPASVDEIRMAMRTWADAVQLKAAVKNELCSIPLACLLSKQVKGTLSVVLPQQGNALAKLRSTSEWSLKQALAVLSVGHVTSARIQYAPTHMNVTVGPHATLKYVFAAGRLHTDEAAPRLSPKQVERLYRACLVPPPEHSADKHSAVASRIRAQIQEAVQAQTRTSKCVAPIILINYNKNLGFQVYWLRKKGAGRMRLVFGLDEHGHAYKARVYGCAFPAEMDALVAATEHVLSNLPANQTTPENYM